MNGPMDIDLPGGWEAGAAEYALGLMPRTEIGEFEARLAAEPDLQQDVAAWTEYFATFTDIIPEATPPAEVQRRIEARVFDDREKQPVPRQILPYAIGAVVGAALASAVFLSGLLEPVGPAMQASLTSEAGAPLLSVRYDAVAGVLTVDRIGDAPGQGRVQELWLAPEGGGEPVSLALLRGAQTLVALPPALRRDLTGARLLVTDEPAGGSPDGRPADETLASGQLTEG